VLECRRNDVIHVPHVVAKEFYADGQGWTDGWTDVQRLPHWEAGCAAKIQT
jgi:hypothetical protein